MAPMQRLPDKRAADHRLRKRCEFQMQQRGERLQRAEPLICAPILTFDECRRPKDDRRNLVYAGQG
jgi:hypothetical protein